jgi:tripartite-type tricarboxylate transporter receptor subunit TctC
MEKRWRHPRSLLRATLGKPAMKLSFRKVLHLMAGVSVLAAVPISLTADLAWSQATRTIKIVVPFPPGGGVDIVARLMADQIGRAQRTSVVVENRPGAGTLIATEAVARAAPDGNTILFLANSFVINAGLRKGAYDPLTSFEPICLLTRSPNAVVVNSASPYRALSDLIADARAKPGNLTMAFQGPATSQHVGAEKLKRAAGIDMINVPFPGSAPAVNAILGGHVAALFVNYPAVAEQVSAGRIRVLATASRARIESMPDVPTVSEVVRKDLEEDVWNGAVVPAKTPGGTVTQLADWLHAAILSAEVRPKLGVQGFSAAGACGGDFASFLREQVSEYGQLIRETNMKAE